MTKHRFIAEKLEAIFICRKKKLVTFSRARTGMNESGSFVQVSMKSRAFCIDRVLVVCANRSGKIFYKVIASKAKTKQYFEAAKDLLCQPGRAESTGKDFQRSLG